eukprot:Amastigsp_a339987_97.p2 type:complete len:149 gc:universal Amastigsp_a339987_97:763-317(-)
MRKMPSIARSNNVILDCLLCAPKPRRFDRRRDRLRIVRLVAVFLAAAAELTRDHRHNAKHVKGQTSGELERDLESFLRKLRAVDRNQRAPLAARLVAQHNQSVHSNMVENERRNRAEKEPLDGAAPTRTKHDKIRLLVNGNLAKDLLR